MWPSKKNLYDVTSSQCQFFRNMAISWGSMNNAYPSTISCIGLFPNTESPDKITKTDQIKYELETKYTNHQPDTMQPYLVVLFSFVVQVLIANENLENKYDILVNNLKRAYMYECTENENMFDIDVFSNGV